MSLVAPKMIMAQLNAQLLRCIEVHWSRPLPIMRAVARSPVLMLELGCCGYHERLERYVIVDLREFPKIRSVPLDSEALLRLIRNGKLTPSGISPKRFDARLAESFAIRIRPFQLQSPKWGALFCEAAQLTFSERRSENASSGVRNLGILESSQSSDPRSQTHSTKGETTIQTNSLAAEKS